MIKVYNMDVMKALKQLPDGSVDMQITSPPYWGLRDYGEGTESIWDGDEICEHEWEIGKAAGDSRIKERSENRAGWKRPSREEYANRDVKNICPVCKKEFEGKPNQKFCSIECLNTLSNEERTNTPQISNFCQKCGAWKGQLGLEPDFDLFVKHLCDVFDEVKRVLKKDGTCFVNLGDTYLGSNQGFGTKPGQGSGIQNVSDGYFGASKQKPPTAKYKLQAKCLAAIPERFMIEMINRGWILRNKIIWHKPNHMPTSVKDRFANSWEYLFFFSKSKKYFFDLDAVREAHKEDSFKRALRGTSGEDKSSLEPMHGYKRPFSPHGILDERALNPKGKNPGDIIEDRTQYLISKLYEIKKDIRDEKISYKGKSKDLKQYNNALANAKAFRSGLKILEQQEKLSEDELKFLKDYVQNHLGHPKGKTPDDIFRDKTLNESFRLSGMRQSPEPNEPHAFHPLGKNPSDSWKDHLRDDERAKLAREQGMITFYSHSKRTPTGFKHADDVIRFSSKEGNRSIIYGTKWSPKNREYNPLGKQPSDYWDITTHGYPEAHFAVFPEKLVEKPIKTTRKNAVIMDIFAGSGTTLAVARKLNRDSIGIEIKKEYCDLIFKRLYKGNIPLDKKEFKLIK